MSRRHFWMLVLGGAMAVGAMSFAAGRLLAAKRSVSDSAGWLAGASASVQTAERQFAENVQELTETVVTAKSQLAALLASSESSDAEIVSQLDRVLESNAALMTAVGRHVVELRADLSAAQRQILMRSCVESLGARVQRRYRWRGGAGDSTTWQGGRRGFGAGQGRGGRQYRGGRASDGELAGALQLTAEQIAFANEVDPGFASESVSLRDEVAGAYAEFAASLEDPEGDDSEILAQLDRVIGSHNRLERRVAAHILTIRGQLTAQQLQRLSGASRGRYRYRGGRAMAPGRSSDTAFLAQTLASQF